MFAGLIATSAGLMVGAVVLFLGGQRQLATVALILSVSLAGTTAGIVAVGPA